MKLIKLTNSEKFALVDDEDYKRISMLNTKWFVHTNYTGYQTILSTRKISPSRKQIRLSRFILNIHHSSFPFVDHVNSCIYNNQEFNLRKAGYSGNSRNRSLQCNNTSGYKGVCIKKSTKKFISEISFKKVKIHIGTYNTAIEAAIAYNAKAVELFGKFAKLNKI